MSHVATIKAEIKDLESLKRACTKIGLEFVEGQKTYKWYGHSVGDYPLPEGFKTSDLGKCEHAIRIPGNSQAYEIGVAKNPKGEGYSLLWDFWNGGFGLEAKVGGDAYKLVQGYDTEVIKENAFVDSFAVDEEVDAMNGDVVLSLWR